MSGGGQVGATRRHRVLAVSAGRTIFSEGDLGTEMYIVQEGEVEIVRGAGAAEHRLALLERGDFFGEMSLLEDLPRSATARAVTDSRLVEISGATFSQMLRDNPEIAVRIMRKLSRRVREADRMVDAAAATPAAGAGRLVHPDSATRFVLTGRAIETVGRRDPVTGLEPVVDLTELDPERSVSRRHAKLERRQGRVYLVEDLATTNGTFVNGRRIEAGTPRAVESGDRLRFGLVELLYEAG